MNSSPRTAVSGCHHCLPASTECTTERVVDINALSVLAPLPWTVRRKRLEDLLEVPPPGICLVPVTNDALAHFSPNCVQADEALEPAAAAATGPICLSEQLVQHVEEVVLQLVRQRALAPALELHLCRARDILLEDRVKPLRERLVPDR